MHRKAQDAPTTPPQDAKPSNDNKQDANARHLHIDPFSGIAGDMFLAALLDLHDDPQAELAELNATLQSLKLDDPFELKLQRVQRCGVGGLDLKVKTQAHSHGHDHSHDHGHGHDHDQGHGHHHHHHVGYAEIMAMVRALADANQLSPRGQRRATQVVTQLADAEARVHGTSRDAVHFHEVGAVDSIVDMLGSVLALERLDIQTLTAGPVPISRGFVRCDHGLMPIPAPATAYLLQGLPTVGVDRTGELVTPTGAALLAGLVDQFGPTPPMTLNAVGYGAGDRDDPQVPNLLRVLQGTLNQPGDLGPVRFDQPPTTHEYPRPNQHDHPHTHPHPHD